MQNVLNQPQTAIRRFAMCESPLRRKTPLEIRAMVETRMKLDLSKKSRKRTLMDAVKIYFWLCHRLYNRPALDRIGETIGKNHSLVLHHANKFPDLFKTDAVFRDYVRTVVGTAEYLRIEKELMEAKAPSYPIQQQ